MRKGLFILLSGLTLLIVALLVTGEPVTAQDEVPTPAPSVIPGQPILVARNFTATPGTTVPGGRVTLQFEVANVGNRIAQGVSVAVETGGKVVPAAGQASVTLPDIGPGTYQVGFLDVTIAKDAPPGPMSLPITMAFYDFEGKPYTAKASLGVNVREVLESPQVSLLEYRVAPEKVQPGKPVTITLTVTNTGNIAAQQVLVRLNDKDGILLPGARGNSFPIGELKAKTSTTIDLPLVVSTGAKDGPQAQPLTISYLQDDKAVETPVSITVHVEFGKPQAPMLLLSAYESGKEPLKPGSKFTLTFKLKNIGDGDATGLLVTYASVDGSSAPPSSGGDGTPTGSDGGSQTSTTPSQVFAILGTGDTFFIGDVPKGQELTIKQEFMISGSVDSGLYHVPITLRYSKPDGSSAQDNLRAILLVLAPPRLQIALQSPLPPQVNVGEPFPLAIRIVNTGKNKVQLTTATITADNGRAVDGGTTEIGALAVDADTSINSMVAADAEGDVVVKLTIRYMDDLNQEQQIVKEYRTSAVLAPPMPTEVFVPPDPSESQQDSDRALLTKFLLGLLGLGS